MLRLTEMTLIVTGEMCLLRHTRQLLTSRLVNTVDKVTVTYLWAYRYPCHKTISKCIPTWKPFSYGVLNREWHVTELKWRIYGSIIVFSMIA